MSGWSGRKKIFVISAGVIVGLLVLLIILGAVLPDPEQSNQGSPVEQPERETRAPVPTLEPTPEEIAECPNPEEKAYFDSAAEKMGLLAGVLGDISRLSIEAGNNILVIHDPSWVAETAIVLASFLQISDGISAMSAPQSLQSIHSDMLQIASTLRAVVPLYSRGVDDLDTDLLVAATEQIGELGRLATVINGKVEDFCR